MNFSPIITSDLFSQLLFTQLVESVELASQGDILQEAAAGQLHSYDDLSVRHHHRHCAELNLQVLRELFTSGVAWVLQ